jgi:hypothetical protein
MNHKKPNPDASLVVRAEQAQKTITVLTREISQVFVMFEESAKLVVETALDNVNCRIRIGVLLRAAKDAVGHGKFGDFVKSHCPFSERSARRFLAFAAMADFKPLASLAELKEFNSVLVAMGLKESEAHGPQELHERNFFVSAVKHLGVVRRSLDELLAHRPIEAMGEPERDQLREQIRPVVELFQKL